MSNNPESKLNEIQNNILKLQKEKEIYLSKKQMDKFLPNTFMTTLDIVETQKLFDAINTRMAFMPMGLDSDSDILWFFRMPNPIAGKEFRDKDKNLWKIHPWDILVSIEAGINKAGVGDGKEPTHAMTYSINYSVTGSKRNFRCKHFYQSDYVHQYAYSRNIEDVVSKFITHLQINVPGYIDHKFIIN